MGNFHLLSIDKPSHLAKLKWVVWIAWFYCGNQLNAQVVLTNKSKQLSIGQQVVFWKDTSGSQTINEIRLIDNEGRFGLSKQRIPNFGFISSTSVYWARFDVKNQSTQDYVLDLAFGNMTHVDFYFVKTDGSIEQHHLGDYLGKAGRVFNYYGYALKLPAVPQQRVYIRIQPYSGQALFPLAIWENQTFYNANQELTLVWGGYLGILITVLIYHLVLSWRTREKGFRLLSLYLLLYLGFECSRGLGLGPRYLWDGYPNLITYAAYFFSTISLLAFLEFYAYVTRAADQARHYLIIVRIAQVCCISLGLVAYFTTSIGQNQLMYYKAILVGLCVIIISISAIWRGNRAAWCYLLAVIAIYSGTFVQSAHRAGAFEDWDSLFLRYAINVGSLIEIMLLSLGVAETVRLERQKRRQAEAQTELEIKARTKIVEEAEVAAKQQELKRMAIELHNNMGNMLLMLRQSISQMHQSTTDSQQLKELGNMTELAQRIYEWIRKLSHSYAYDTASVLQARGLNVALKELVTNQNRFAKAPHFLYSMQGSDLLLSESIQYELYNTCTELINNILKHAQATTASIRIQVTDDEVILVVTDNGVGIPKQVTEGLGMQQLRQRAQRLKATLHIYSQEKGRCEISMALPIGGAS
ncbi:sensor histidine kinase [Runella aurantiaca]|uniref:histidine kinase n=1 Tax=Runella aurantiaca TaxID=2282308 RepID=A0A369ICY0_9BACT|nr:7TM diverse intracellular signaling domain-containing protein [Runella aurantiaca]RDB07518.1 hypothetical protein DVG78_00160 [Runella aurantiaca]